MRHPIIVGNWKMNMFISSSIKWVEELLDNIKLTGAFDVVIAPPFTAISVVHSSIGGSKVKLAGQNISSEVEGAYTGDVSANMLNDAGCDYVILGHSERRQYHYESDQLINKKLILAFASALNVIFCVGETVDERTEGRTNKVLERQLSVGLNGLKQEQFKSLSIAYEPVWAIGTGQTADSNQVQVAHNFIRKLCEKSFGKDLSQSVRILYGGSVSCQNSSTLMSQPDVDGLLVGGASLRSESFCDIIKSSFIGD